MIDLHPHVERCHLRRYPGQHAPVAARPGTLQPEAVTPPLAHRLNHLARTIERVLAGASLCRIGRWVIDGLGQDPHVVVLLPMRLPPHPATAQVGQHRRTTSLPRARRLKSDATGRVPVAPRNVRSPVSLTGRTLLSC